MDSEKYKKIMSTFGFRNQMKKLNEEVFEFLEAVDNYEDELAFHLGDKVFENMCRDNVVEELSDVLVLLIQFMEKYEIDSNEIDTYIDYKLNRTLDRIKSGYYDKKED